MQVRSESPVAKEDVILVEDQTSTLPITEAPHLAPELIVDAYEGAQAEHQLKILKAIRVYRKAAFWIFLMSLGAFMQSYDQLLTGSFYAYPAFRRTFGTPVDPHAKPLNYQVSSENQSALSACQNVGGIFGYMINGALVDRFGMKKMAIVTYVLCTGLIFVLFFAKNMQQLMIGEFFLNFPLGFIHSIAPAYAVELAPLALRHWGPTWVHINENMGHIFGTSLLLGFSGKTSEWAWRIPFAVQWAFPAVVFIPLIFAPESPWWLVRKHRHEEANHALKRINGGDVDNQQLIAMMEHTIEYERSLSFGVTYWDLFKGTDRRRTEIAVGIFFSQQMASFGLKNSAYFFEQAGIPTTQSFGLQIGQYMCVLVTSFITMYLLGRVGRRPLWLYGNVGTTIVSCVIGILASVPEQIKPIEWAQAVLVLVRFFIFGFSISTLPFLVASEISNVRLRAKTISAALMGSNVATLITSVTQPYLLNPKAANLKGKGAWVSAGVNVIILAWAYFRLPETKGRTSEELDVLFAKRVPTREFGKYVINQQEQYGAGLDKAQHAASTTAEEEPVTVQMVTLA